MKKLRLLCFLGLLILTLPCFGEIKWGSGKEEALNYFGTGYEISDCGGGTVCYTYKNIQKSDVWFTETGLRFWDDKLISWYGTSDMDSDTAMEIMKKYEKKYGMKFEYIEPNRVSRLFYKNEDGEIYVFFMKEEQSYYFTVYYKGSSEIRLEAEKDKETEYTRPMNKEEMRRDI